MHEKLSP